MMLRICFCLCDEKNDTEKPERNSCFVLFHIFFIYCRFFSFTHIFRLQIVEQCSCSSLCFLSLRNRWFSWCSCAHVCVCVFVVCTWHRIKTWWTNRKLPWSGSFHWRWNAMASIIFYATESLLRKVFLYLYLTTFFFSFHSISLSISVQCSPYILKQNTKYRNN